jgi:hypothetical protein
MLRTPALPAILLLISAFSPEKSQAQIDQTITAIVDRFNHIEENLTSMKHIVADASHADSDALIGLIEVWLEDGNVAKVRNEHKSSDSATVQEFWLDGNLPAFVFERSEWYGNQDGSVNISEYRYYLNGGRVIREMSRSDIRQKGQDLDISGVAHQTNDDFDEDYGKSLYDDKDMQIEQILDVAQAFATRDSSSPDLLTLPYRLLLNTLSPDNRLAFAWGDRWSSATGLEAMGGKEIRISRHSRRGALPRSSGFCRDGGIPRPDRF